MAEKEQELKETKASKTAKAKQDTKPRSKAGRKAKSKTTAEAQKEKPPQASGTEEPGVDGEEKLREAVEREVAARSTAIAKKLAEQAVDGNTACTKILVDLITGKKLKKKTNQQTESGPLDAWETEAEWKDGEQGNGEPLPVASEQ